METEVRICTLDNLHIDHPKSVYKKLVNFIGEEQDESFINTVDVSLVVPRIDDE